MLEIIQFPKNGYVVIQPSGAIQVVETETQPTLEEAQAIVGGFVEEVVLLENENLEIYVNEEGLLKEMAENALATALCKTFLVGPALVLCGSARWSESDWEDEDS